MGACGCGVPESSAAPRGGGRGVGGVLESVGVEPHAARARQAAREGRCGLGVYTIHLERVELVRRAALVRFVIRTAFEPLVQAAGYELNLVSVPLTQTTPSAADVSLEYRLNRDVLNPNRRMLAEQSGRVLLGSILDMRVEGGPSRLCATEVDPTAPLRWRRRVCRAEYAGATRALFSPGEAAFARTVGNISVHELGHTIGGLRHMSDPMNFMFTGASIRPVLGAGARTYSNLRRYWSGIHWFEEQQRSALTRAIRARTLLGVDMARVEGT